MTTIATTGPVPARLGAKSADAYVETQDTQGSPDPVRVVVVRLVDAETGAGLGVVALGADEAERLAMLLTIAATMKRG